VLAQRTPMPAARKAKRALVEHFGNRMRHDGRDFWAFPDAAQLAALDESALAALVGNARKARYLAGIVASYRRVDESYLRTGPYDQVERFLLGLPGIGPWSASFVLIRGLGRMERLPLEPASLKAAERLYQEPVSEHRFAELAAPYGEQRGYWAHYLRVAG
jgi:DNA-3-methyladenine glycosylase II